MRSYSDELNFSEKQEEGVELRGFWQPEQTFVWSRGKTCELIFDFEEPNAYPYSDFIFDADCFRPEDEDAKLLVFYLNGLRVSAKEISFRSTFAITVRTSILLKIGNNLTIDTPNADSPARVGISEDIRVLGIQLFSLRIRAAE